MIRILVLENDPRLNVLICDYLNNNGFQATGYLYSEDALLETCSKLYELIVAEVASSDSDILQFVQTIRTFSIETPILFISEKDSLADKKIEFRLGTDDYMDRSFWKSF